MSRFFQKIKDNIILFFKINIVNIFIVSMCITIILKIIFSVEKLQSNYINLFFQFIIPTLLVIPIIEQVRPFFSKEIGEIIGGEVVIWKKVLFTEVICILYIGILAMIIQFLFSDSANWFIIIVFQTFFLQGMALIGFIMSGSVYTGCLLPFFLQGVLSFIMIELPEIANIGLIVETNYDVKQYFLQRWHLIIFLLLEWCLFRVMYRNRFKYCKWI